MNIIEAIKSGKRFKRKVWLHYPAEYKFTPDEIVADDWEIEQTYVTITREQLLDAYLAAGKSDDVKHGRIDLINAIAKELGL